MNNITTSILLLTAALAPCSAYAANPVAIGYGNAKESKDIVFTVSNPSDMARNEMVEIAEAPATPFLLMDARGHEVPYQITHDGKIIFRVSIPAKAGIDYKLVPGTPMPVDTICYGRIFPERKDDLAWENDRGAFRAYGPALQQSGEKAYGYDVWTKSVTEPVLEQRFYDDRVKRISFHIDHGKGMDVYAVGPTLGGGTSALMLPGDSIVMPYCWAEARVLDNGPLRFTAELTYNPVRIGGNDVIEHRLITLDAGDCLNKTTVWYDNLPADARPIAGIVVHDSNPQGYDFGNGFVTYTDYTQEPGANNGEIYLALCGDKTMKVRYIPFDAPRGDAVGHVILSAPEGADRMRLVERLRARRRPMERHSPLPVRRPRPAAPDSHLQVTDITPCRYPKHRYPQRIVLQVQTSFMWTSWSASSKMRSMTVYPAALGWTAGLSSEYAESIDVPQSLTNALK